MGEIHVLQKQWQPLAAGEEDEMSIIIHQPSLRSIHMHIGEHVCKHVGSIYAVEKIVLQSQVLTNLATI